MTVNTAASEWGFPNRATPPGSSAYYSVRFAPLRQRGRLAALFGWRREVRGVLERVSDVGVARLKLDWWRTEAERIAAGEPRHPVGLTMVGGPGELPLPLAPMLALIDGVEARLRGALVADDAAWRAAGEADLGALFELFAVAAGEPAKLTAARQIGGWCAAVRALRDAGRHLHQGRAVLPLSRLTAAGLDAGALTAPVGREWLSELLMPLAEQLADAQSSRALVAGLPAVVRSQWRIHAALLSALVSSGLAVADQRIGLTPLRKLILAWRASTDSDS